MNKFLKKYPSLKITHDSISKARCEYSPRHGYHAIPVQRYANLNTGVLTNKNGQYSSNPYNT